MTQMRRPYSSVKDSVSIKWLSPAQRTVTIYATTTLIAAPLVSNCRELTACIIILSNLHSVCPYHLFRRVSQVYFLPSTTNLLISRHI